MSATDTIAPLALTMGEPAGIGGEVALKAWRAAQSRGSRPPHPFFIIDDPRRLARLAKALRLDVPMAEIASPSEAGAAFPDALPVLPLKLPVESSPGTPLPATAAAVIEAIERAVAAVMEGRAAAVVTNPIHKETLYAAGFTHPGHTEFLGELARRHTGKPATPVMMLAAEELRVVPVTVHMALRDVPARLDKASIVTCGRIAAAELTRDFGIAKPRLAVAALNPHAGEGGALGTEEREIIAPAVAELRALGIAAHGPVAADTLFHEEARQGYDAALCMYHDQALIPLKTLAFDRGINITLGLPFIRTSPDHGTAFDIAGTGKARETSLLAALDAAAAMAQRRAAGNGHARVA